jgi:DNA-binding phage protein
VSLPRAYTSPGIGPPRPTRGAVGLEATPSRRLNEQVRRNQQRFPADFIFEVSDEEVRNLMSQFATSSWGGTRKRPLAFTEHGAIMAASVLNSPGAVEMSVFVVRAFVQFRTALLSTRVAQQAGLNATTLYRTLSGLKKNLRNHDSFECAHAATRRRTIAGHPLQARKSVTEKKSCQGPVARGRAG